MKLPKLLLTLLLTASVSILSAQELVVIGGVRYTIHDVAKGETLYSLSRQYGVSIEDIKGANAALAEGLKAGQRIRIPVKATEANVATSQTQQVETPQEPKAEVTVTSTITHKVARRETLYSLSKRYDVTIDELYAHNPHIKGGLKAGQIMTIPVKKVASQSTPAPQQTTVAEPAPTPVKEKLTKESRVTVAPPQQHTVTDSVATTSEQTAPAEQSASAEQIAPIAQTPLRTLKQGERAEVALMLPLGSEERPSQNYLDFYRGFLIGLDSVRMAGHSVNLNLYNTAHDYNRVTEIIASGALNRADLVVGPVYEDELIPVADALKERGVAVVSPLANLTQSSGSHIFQMSPSPASKLDKVRGMFDGSQRVVIISTDNVDKEFDAEVRGMLKGNDYVVEHKYVYEHPSVIEKREKERQKMREAGLTVDETPSPSDMSPLLQGDTPSMIVITADNEIEVDRILAAIASANISLTARSQRVVPFVVFGNNRWNRYRNIDRAIFFSNNVTMLSTYHARRSEPLIKGFDKRFVAEYGLLPSLYAYRGYDAAVIFVKSLYGTMETGLEGVLSLPLLTPYAFEANPTSGVRINNQWVKVNYNSNFTITIE